MIGTNRKSPRESLKSITDFIRCCKTAKVVTTWSLFHRSDSEWPIPSRFLTVVSNESTASDDPAAPDRTDPVPAPAQHSEVERGCPDRLSILDGISGAVLLCHGNLHRPVQRYWGTWSRLARWGHYLAAAPRDLLDRRPYFPRECAPILRHQQRHQRRHVRLGHGLLRANDCHFRDRRLVTSRPQPGELRWAA